MPPKTRDVRDRLMANLQEHAGLTTEDIEELKHLSISLDYFSRDDHTGGIISFDSSVKRYRADGTEHTFGDVPMKKLLRDVESFIETKVSENERTHVFKSVMADIPGAKLSPDWERPVINPHERPESEFSVSRAPPESRKSNSQLIDALAEAAELERQSAKLIGVQITWWDAMGDEKQPPIMCLGPDAAVRGGRLGRDHTLADVPNHYVRDRLMHYINTQLSQNKREISVKAVFDDLSAAEIESYSAAVLKQQKDLEDEPVIRALARSKNPGETKVAAEEQAAFDAIDTSIDLTPRPRCHLRNYDSPLPLAMSVVAPGVLRTEREEDSYSFEPEIDRDCDQIRTMIKIFIQQGEWSRDEFRSALGLISRPTFVKFLKAKGPAAGKRQHVYQLSWEFFKRRELLGFPFQPNKAHALKKADGNRGRKRQISSADTQDKKRARPKVSTVTTRSSRQRKNTIA